MTRSLRTLLLVTLLLALAAGAQAGDKLFLWKVEGRLATIHMTGSIHVGRPDFFPLPSGIGGAFAASDVLAVEVDMLDPAVQQEAARLTMTEGLLPGEETLESSLDPELYARLEQHAAERGISLAMFGKFRPSIVAMALVMEEYKRLGFDDSLGVDRHFLDAARKMEKEIRQLESIEDQMALFLQMSDTLDDLMVQEVLDQSTEILEFTDRMITNWRAGDADALDELLQSQMGDDPEIRAFYRKLLDDRNVAMVTTLDNWLHGADDVFVVVGAAHFGGEKGILKLLEEKGWQVQQIEE